MGERVENKTEKQARNLKADEPMVIYLEEPGRQNYTLIEGKAVKQLYVEGNTLELVARVTSETLDHRITAPASYYYPGRRLQVHALESVKYNTSQRVDTKMTKWN